jgi:hypothetical protein
MLADIRFKLPALVPTVTGLVVTLLAGSHPAPKTLAAGLEGLVVTQSIIVCELRSTQFYDTTGHGAKWLEVMPGLPVYTKGEDCRPAYLQLQRRWTNRQVSCGRRRRMRTRRTGWQTSEP